MKDGYYKAVIHGWLEFFKFVDNKPLGLETGKKSTWYPTLIEQSRIEQMEPISIEEIKLQYPEFVTTNQKATDEDILGSIKNGFANKRMGA